MTANSSSETNTNTTNSNTMGVTSAATGRAAVAPTSSISLPQNRFELELEFVQSLASPAYLHFLATSGLLYQSSFLDFLRYLRYWKQPQYAKYLSYPHCLYFLDLLVPPSSDDVPSSGDPSERTTSGVDEGEAFRREMAQVQFRNFVHEQQFYSWQFRSARLYGKGSASEEGHVGDGATTNNEEGNTANSGE